MPASVPATAPIPASGPGSGPVTVRSPGGSPPPPPPAMAGVAAAPAGVTPAQLEAIRVARQRGRRITRAATVAAISGWTMAFFAFVTLLSGIFSLRAFLLGVALAAVAWVEIRGSARLRAFDRRAPGQLALNQVALIVAVSIYAGWGIVTALTGPGIYADQIAAGGPVAEMLEPYQDLARSINVWVGAGFIVASVLAQGSAALWYRSRRRHLDRFLAETPDWVTQMLRA